jgi:hypothetical protein
MEITDAELDALVEGKPKLKRKGGQRVPEKIFDKALELIALGHSQTSAARELGISWTTIRSKVDRDPDYAKRFDDANEASIQVLEDECRRRATNGSDLLLIFLLKARRPNVYRDNVRHEHEGRVDLRLQVAAEEFERRFADRAERVRAIEATGLRDS